MTYTIVVPFALLLTVAFIVLWSMVRALINRPIKRGHVELRGIEELPLHLRTAFESPLAQLGELGFREDHCELTNSIFGSQELRIWTLHCANTEDRAMAVIQAPLRSDQVPYEVMFHSRDRDGAAFSSFNWMSHLYIPGMPDWAFQDTRTTNLAEAFRFHLQARSEMTPDPIIPDQSTRAADAQLFLDNYVKYLNDTGWTERISDNEYRFRLLPAVRLAARIAMGETRAKRALRKARPESATAYSRSPELELDLYKRFESRVGEWRPVHWIVKLGLFLVSAAAFCAILGFVIPNSWRWTLLLAVAIFFHELGHLAGMWLFGYRDLQILFIPAFGAMTTGMKDDAKAWQRATVSFLGPLPGIVASCVLLFAFDVPTNSWLFDLSVVMLVINYLNLVPLKPLDGGYIIETAIMYRFPYVSSILTGISAIIFAIAGWFLSDVVLLFPAAFLLFLARSQWILARAQRSLTGVTLEDDDYMLRAVFTELQKPPYKSISFATKVRFARQVLNQRRQGEASTYLSWACMAIQLGALVIPPALFIIAFNFL